MFHVSVHLFISALSSLNVRTTSYFQMFFKKNEYLFFLGCSLCPRCRFKIVTIIFNHLLFNVKYPIKASLFDLVNCLNLLVILFFIGFGSSLILYRNFKMLVKQCLTTLTTFFCRNLVETGFSNLPGDRGRGLTLSQEQTHVLLRMHGAVL